MVALKTSTDPLLEALRDFAPLTAHMEPHLEAAITQATGETGKLVRARLTAATARAGGLDETEALQLACGVEYFHTASLLLDDLPCMDNADTRRGRPCAHREHGDATAILAALALINRAYTLVGFAFAGREAPVRLQALACVDACLGPSGLVGGQAADLRYAEGPGGARTTGRIAAAKTGSLFWLSVYLPALAGSPSETERRDLKELCIYWGLAFQAMDDLGDLMRSSAEAGKSTGRDSALTRPNLALAIGAPAARARVARLARLAGAASARVARRGERWGFLRKFHEDHFEFVPRGAAATALAAA